MNKTTTLKISLLTFICLVLNTTISNANEVEQGVTGVEVFSDEDLFNYSIMQFKEGLAPTFDDKNEKFYYIDNKGKIQINKKLYDVSIFSEGLASVSVSKPKLSMENFEERLKAGGDFTIPFKGKYGFINKEGKFVINPQFEKANAFSEEVALVMKDDKYGFINKKGEFTIKPEFDYAEDFSEGLALVKKNNTFGYINKNGKFIIQPKYMFVSSFSEGLAFVNFSDGKFGYINKNDKLIFNTEYIAQGKFSNGLANVLSPQNSKCGYINKKGELIIPTIFDTCDKFSQKIAKVSINKKYGFIDTNGKFIIEPKFINASNYSEGYIYVVEENKKGYMDLNSNYIWFVAYESKISSNLSVEPKDNKLSSLESNMNTYKDMLETYSIDYGRTYPTTIIKMEEDAKLKRYWHELKNSYDSNSSYFIDTYKNYLSASDKTKFKGVILYEPLMLSEDIAIGYKLYGIDDNGKIIDTALRN